MKEHNGLLLIWAFGFGFGLGFISIVADTDPSDASALNVMYSSMNSPPQLTGWTSSGGDPCGQSWKGVTCSNSRVTQLKISGLGLTGSIGYQLTSLTALTDFDISNNNFGNQVPYNLPPKLQRLNLASCNFNGVVPYSISLMTALEHLDLSHNQFNGQLTLDFSKLSSLSSMDLSDNSLTGNLSTSFSSLTSLKSLYLQNNQFTGTIDVLADLPLQTLNVANNQFTGWIPWQLRNINLKKGGNSWNSGPAPPAPPGARIHRQKSENHKKSSHDSESGSNKSGPSAGGICGIVIAILAVGAIVGFFIFKRRTRRPTMDVEKVDMTKPLDPISSHDVQELKPNQYTSTVNPTTLDTVTVAPVNLKPPPLEHNKSFDEKELPKQRIVQKIPTPVPDNVKSYSIADLQMATNSFSIENLIGEGSIGRVYRAVFDGKVLAVKKIDSTVVDSHSGHFTEIVASISRLHHSNISELVGYCSEHGQHLLIYEFHKNGSLHDFLHLEDEYSKPLTWNTRVKIALGSARALEYLHEVCSPSIVHQNFKSENILLDADFEPHVSESGLASLFPNTNQAINHNVCAPEFTDTGEYTLKSDVYSFGIVMLELLTGRKPFDSSRPRAEQSLVRWATPQLHDIDSLTKMVDPTLEGLYPVKSLSHFADVIALCVQPEPGFRPPISEVVQALLRLVERANMSKRTVGNGVRRTASLDMNDSVN